MNRIFKKYRLSVLFAVLGGIIGYIYWFYRSCENGCPIKSVWWMMVLYGSLLGWLAGESVKDFLVKD
jgi:hypothetical protein